MITKDQELSTDQALCDFLAERVLGWKPTPDRYVTPQRSWLPKWKFQPHVRIQDAFRLLEFADEFRVERSRPGIFYVEVRIQGRGGNAEAGAAAAAIVSALANALSISVGRRRRHDARKA